MCMENMSGYKSQLNKKKISASNIWGILHFYFVLNGEICNETLLAVIIGAYSRLFCKLLAAPYVPVNHALKGFTIIFLHWEIM